MSTLLVAKKDFQDAIRSRSLLGVSFLFTSFLAFLLYYKITLETPAEPFSLSELYLPMASVVALVGTLLGYNAIAGEIESGSVLFLLGTAHTRTDVLFGKLLGRGAVVAVTVLVGFAVCAPHYAVLIETPPEILTYAGLAGKILSLGVVFVSIAIGFSSVFQSETLAVWGGVCLAVGFSFGWDSFLAVVKTVLFTSLTLPPWYYLLTRLNPKYAYLSIDGAALEYAPFYLDAWFGLVILAGWVIAPLGIAYWQFNRGDLA